VPAQALPIERSSREKSCVFDILAGAVDAQCSCVCNHFSESFVVIRYATRNLYIDHTCYMQLDRDRTIERIFRRPPMMRFDRAAARMWTLFTNHPKMTLFNVLANRVPSHRMKPGSTAALPIDRAWPLAPNKMCATKTTIRDAEDPVMPNHVMWHSATGLVRPYLRSLMC
jgi:hypothetical protein